VALPTEPHFSRSLSSFYLRTALKWHIASSSDQARPQGRRGMSPVHHFRDAALLWVAHANFAQHIDEPVTSRSHRAANCRSALTQLCSQNFLAPWGSARLEDNVEA
jgi:hypothetical protein